MKKFLFKSFNVLLTIVTVTMLITACSSAKDDKISDENIIRVGLDNTFVPMGFLDENNELSGFDIDLAKEAFKRAGYTPEFENIEWSLKEQSLNNKNVDCLWNGYTITEERMKKVAFSKPYLDNKQIIISMADSNINNIKDLTDKPVGTQAASSALEAIEANEKFLNIIKDKQPATYDTYDKALRDLEIGRIKAVVGDEVLLKYYIKQKGTEKYKILAEDLGSEEYGVGFRIEDVELREKIDSALEDMKKDGTFDIIKSKWFN